MSRTSTLVLLCGRQLVNDHPTRKWLHAQLAALTETPPDVVFLPSSIYTDATSRHELHDSGPLAGRNLTTFSDGGQILRGDAATVRWTTFEHPPGRLPDRDAAALEALRAQAMIDHALAGPIDRDVTFVHLESQSSHRVDDDAIQTLLNRLTGESEVARIYNVKDMPPIDAGPGLLTVRWLIYPRSLPELSGFVRYARRMSF